MFLLFITTQYGTSRYFVITDSANEANSIKIDENTSYTSKYVDPCAVKLTVCMQQ